ncbi:KR domain-containing protein [Apiosordaria backusii]|uniref:KR domain-containing protein n=1 Tax=Apiosordaria backusii TaxID=314023 RepID=A0AA40E1X1_9PEZI|nr:KR domain-containing protein [Apiosordaria backusii]
MSLDMKSQSTGSMEMREESGEQGRHCFMKEVYRPDITTIFQLGKRLAFRRYCQKEGRDATQYAIDLVAHKYPLLTVLEVNLDGKDKSSLWLDGFGCPRSSIRATCSGYHFMVADPETLVAVQSQYASRAPRGSEFGLLDMTAGVPNSAGKFDLVIVKGIPEDKRENVKLLNNLCGRAKEGGFVLSVGGMLRYMAPAYGDDRDGRPLGEGVYLRYLRPKATSPRPRITIVRFKDTPALDDLQTVLDVLEKGTGPRWYFNKDTDPGPNDPVLVLDEMATDIMTDIDSKQWAILQSLIQQQNKILWVTVGANLNVTNPNRAAITGLFRSIRSEDPTARLITLDVEDSWTVENTAAAISTCLNRLTDSPSSPAGASDYEFVSREGMIHVARIVPDPDLNYPPRPRTFDILTHDKIVQLGVQTIGDIDSLVWSEAPRTAPPAGNEVEVQVYAAGLNHKDLLVTMGTMPGDQRMLGGEAAGYVVRVGGPNTGFRHGDRVVVFSGGAIANRIITNKARAHRIPDWMSFEQAATLCAVYLTCMHALLGLADLKKGQRILIHNPESGVGIAAFQLAKYAGAEIFAMVCTPGDREYLMYHKGFNLPEDHIFDSRTTEFAEQILQATNGNGVDVVFNTTTNDMLDTFLRTLGDGRTIIELGKRDIHSSSNLPVKPLDRNISFYTVDMSPEQASNEVVAGLMSKMFHLINQGHIRPITPMKIFHFTEAPSALRFLSEGKHISKVVLSVGGIASRPANPSRPLSLYDIASHLVSPITKYLPSLPVPAILTDRNPPPPPQSPRPRITVPFYPSPPNLTLCPKSSYLIVGDLKGITGTLALFLAEHGARHLTIIIQPSNTSDSVSQSIITQLTSLGTNLSLPNCDISSLEQLQSTLSKLPYPIKGVIIQCTIPPHNHDRDFPFELMTHEQYTAAIQPKITGTWNLHNLFPNVDFFVLLRSLSGVLGTKGHAHHAAVNTFLTSFAEYRRGLSMKCYVADLGLSEPAGFTPQREGSQEKNLDNRGQGGVDEVLLRRVFHEALVGGKGRIITGLSKSQLMDKLLRNDARFGGLLAAGGEVRGGCTTRLASGGIGND